MEGTKFMKYIFSKDIYEKESILKAAYSFTDKAYIHLDANENSYIVFIEVKDGYEKIEEKEFQNELLAQMVRKKVFEQTKHVRELMLARAFSSTIIEQANDINEKLREDNCEHVNDDDILIDWFEKNE